MSIPSTALHVRWMGPCILNLNKNAFKLDAYCIRRGSVCRGSALGGLHPGGSASGGSASRGVCIQGGLPRGSASRGVCIWGVWIRGGLHPGGLHWEGVCLEESAWGGLLTPPGLPTRGRGWADPLPPVNRMTHRCKNITLPETLFAGSNNVIPEKARNWGCGKRVGHDLLEFLKLVMIHYQLKWGACFYGNYDANVHHLMSSPFITFLVGSPRQIPAQP